MFLRGWAEKKNCQIKTKHPVKLKNKIKIKVLKRIHFSQIDEHNFKLSFSWKCKMKSREEIRFLTLLAKTQDKTSKLKKLPANSDEIQESNEDSCADEWRLPKVT